MSHSSDDIPDIRDIRVRELLDGWIAGGLTPQEDAEAKRVASAVFGHPDGLELLRETLVEEGMLEALLERIGRDRDAGLPTVRSRDADALPSRGWKGSDHPWARPRSWYGSAKRVAAILLIAGGVMAMGIELVHAGRGRRPEPVLVATLPGQRTSITLPDGSRATLAPNTKLRYSISHGRGPREVSLDGEAYFEVRHDEARPFRVRTASAVVKDLGTEFVVRGYAADTSVRVAVRSGAVAVSASAPTGAPATGLRAGQAVEVNSRGAVVRLTADTAPYWSWVNGRLAFDATPLPEVLDRLSRWYGVEFRMTDSTLAEQYFTGAFDAVPLPRALEILGPLVHAGFEQRSKVIVVTPRPGGR